jgi:hypothetical protein
MKQLQLLQLLQLFILSVVNKGSCEISKMFENDLFAFFVPFCPIDFIYHIASIFHIPKKRCLSVVCEFRCKALTIQDASS